METDYSPNFIRAYGFPDKSVFSGVRRNRLWLYDSGLVHVSSDRNPNDLDTDRWAFCKVYEKAHDQA